MSLRKERRRRGEQVEGEAVVGLYRDSRQGGKKERRENRLWHQVPVILVWGDPWAHRRRTGTEPVMVADC